jgi:hypothetical protein
MILDRTLTATAHLVQASGRLPSGITPGTCSRESQTPGPLATHHSRWIEVCVTQSAPAPPIRLLASLAIATREPLPPTADADPDAASTTRPGRRSSRTLRQTAACPLVRSTRVRPSLRPRWHPAPSIHPASSASSVSFRDLRVLRASPSPPRLPESLPIPFPLLPSRPASWRGILLALASNG